MTITTLRIRSPNSANSANRLRSFIMSSYLLASGPPPTLLQQPAQQVTVWCAFTVNLHIEPALLQRVDLVGSQIKCSGNGSARPLSVFGNGEIENRVSAHTGERPEVKVCHSCR